ncbi:MAG: hypothetical protein OXN97_08310 [Bryobacterales bacterium]|nr:hypothetical protein [Bryobacterales bacterium]MDE0629823.1 hypothetical protein [Bryobacterales bacterium]
MQSTPELTDAAVARLARRQLEDYDARRPGTVFAERSAPLSEKDGYRIQLATTRLRRSRGESVAGFKIGCVSDAIQTQLGVENPVFGHVYRSEIRASPATLPAGDFCQLGIEGEFAVTLSRDVDDLERLSQEPSRYVASVLPVIELHNFVFRGPKPYAGELIANNALNAGIVVSRRRSDRAGCGRLRIDVAISDRVSDSAEVDPCNFLHALSSRLEAHGIRPRKGDLLLTGSPLPLYLVEPGDSIHVVCDGLAEVSATVTPD